MPRTPVKKVKTTIIVTDVTNDTKIDAALEFRERVYNDDVYVDEETIKKLYAIIQKIKRFKTIIGGKMYNKYLYFHDEMVADQGNKTNLEFIDIVGLFDRYSIHINFDKQANIYIGENGLGKTTILRCIHLVLVNDYYKLARIQFEKIRVKFKGTRIIEVSKEDIKDYLNRRVRKERSIEEYYIDRELERYLNYAINSYNVEKLSDDDEWHRMAMNISAETGLSYNIVRNILRDKIHEYSVKDNKGNRSRVVELSRAISKNLNQRIIYLPTYRRIENDFEEFNFSAEGKGKNRSEMLIRFGMSDVNASIESILEKIRNLAMKGFTEMTGVLLKEYADGGTLLGSHGTKTLNYETVKIVLDRVGNEIEDSYKYKILDLVKNERIYSNSYLYGLLIRLIDNYELQKVYDDRIKRFAETCNKYLIDKHIDYNPSVLSLRVLMDNDQKDSSAIGLEQLSSGEKQIVSLFSKLYLESDEKSIVIIDEPELSLSIQWQKSLLPDIIRTSNCDLLVTVTHSPFVFENEFDDNAREMRRYITKYR